MAEEKIIVCAKIDQVVAVVRKHIVVRDHDAEKKVKQELTEKLKKSGTFDNLPSKEFQSQYRTKLRSYASYVDARYVVQDEEDGEPGLLISKPAWEYDLRISYSVDGHSYTENVTYCTETKSLEAGNPFYITVLKNRPKTIQFKSHKDYRQPDNGAGEGHGWLILLAVAALFVWLLFGGGR